MTAPYLHDNGKIGDADSIKSSLEKPKFINVHIEGNLKLIFGYHK